MKSIKKNGFLVKKIFLLPLFLSILGTSLPAYAQTTEDELIFGIGAFDVNKRKKQSLEGRIEYRWEPKLWKFRPLIGIMGNTDRATYYYTGIGLDFYFASTSRISITFGPGYYEQRDSKYLGHALEFKSQIEAWHGFGEHFKLGIALSHLSNANIGKKNPGTENLLLQCAFDM